jgi:AcrR family transcriptional regulator
LTQLTIKKKEEDLRVRRTRKQLLEAMISLVIEKGFNSVTVQDISERAMVNRATFYRYYKDKYDLLDQYVEEQYSMQLAYDDTDHQALNPKETPADPPEGLVRVWEHIQAHAAFFRVMLGPKGDPTFTQKIRANIEKRVRDSLPDKIKADVSLPLDLCLSYISGASIGLIIWWLESDMPFSPTQMADWNVRFSNADLAAALGISGLPKKPAEPTSNVERS